MRSASSIGDELTLEQLMPAPHIMFELDGVRIHPYAVMDGLAIDRRTRSPSSISASHGGFATWD